MEHSLDSAAGASVCGMGILSSQLVLEAGAVTCFGSCTG